MVCRDPGGVSNGGYRVISNRIGGKVTYYCNSGYSLSGNEERTCQRDGSGASWSGSTPSCQRELSVGVGGGEEVCLRIRRCVSGRVCLHISGCVFPKAGVFMSVGVSVNH